MGAGAASHARRSNRDRCRHRGRRVSVQYIGQSGGPYDYVYTGSGGRGDLNADGVFGNDLIYVPTSAFDAAQIEFTGQPTFTFNPTFKKFLISNNPSNYYQLQVSARLSF